MPLSRAASSNKEELRGEARAQATNVERNELTAALGVWREGLVNLSGVNRLIKFKASKSNALEIDSPEPDFILSGLRSGAKWLFMGSEKQDEGAPGPLAQQSQLRTVQATDRDRVLHTPRPENEIGTVLRGLMRRANEELLDRGLSVLYIAFGMLHWEEVDETGMASPLLLVPVTLISRGPKTTPELAQGEDDTVVNPSLVLRMREFGIELPNNDDVAELSVVGLLARIREAVSIKQGWAVESTVVLSTFSFHKEAIIAIFWRMKPRCLPILWCVRSPRRIRAVKVTSSSSSRLTPPRLIASLRPKTRRWCWMRIHPSELRSRRRLRAAVSSWMALREPGNRRRSRT